jgi:UDP-N-acetylmuramate--alanine ligase
MDFHQTMERLNESFLDFINKIPFYGLAVLCLDNAHVRALLPKVRKRFGPMVCLLTRISPHKIYG